MRSKIILIIDGDVKDRKNMGEILSKVGGYKDIIFAKTGRDGIKKFKLKKPDVVVVALALPDLKGFEVCKQIKTIAGTNSKVVLITGKLNAIEPQWRQNSNADEFLTKTPTYESLVRTVAKLI